MSGILRRVSALGGLRIWQGVPEKWFPEFLLFETVKVRRRTSFPSWSWAGWTGELWWGAPYGNCTLTFYEVDCKGATRMIGRPRKKLTRDFFSTWRWKLHHNQQLRPWEFRSYPLLKFRAPIINMKWKSTTEFDGEYVEDTSPQIRLMDKEGNPVGMLFLDTRDLTEVPDGPLCLAVLGSNVRNEPPSGPLAPLRQLPDKRLASEALTASVMHLKMVNGIWERRGLGILREDCLSSYAPSVETVLLG